MDEEAGQGPLRLRLDLAYDGSAFSGWAAQPGRRTVEGELAAALATILRTREVRLTVAGRTDAGVHARGQVAHTDVAFAAYASVPGRSQRLPEDAAVARLGAVLPPDLVVRSVSPAAAGFDARFSALSRRYSYRIADRHAGRDPLRRHDTVWLGSPLDADAMNRAGQQLLGEHDFAAFCRRREGASTVRTLLELRWERLDDGVLQARVVADAFCHSMVRALVGAAVAVGSGRRPTSWPADVLASGSRSGAVKVMPAHGLCLEEVSYPDGAGLADRARVARALREPR